MRDHTREVIADVEHERIRQKQVKGWSPEHDDAEHDQGHLAFAACAYALPRTTPEWTEGNIAASELCRAMWPWGGDPKYKTRRQDLVRAAALLVAEIERIDREYSRGNSAGSAL